MFRPKPALPAHAGILDDGTPITTVTKKAALSNEASRRGLETSGSRKALLERLQQATVNGNDGGSAREGIRNFVDIIIEKPAGARPQSSVLFKLGILAAPPLRQDFEDIRVPDKFICALTRRIVRDPVIAANGLTYEKAEIIKTFETLPPGFDPVTSDQHAVTHAGQGQWFSAQRLHPAGHLVGDFADWLQKSYGSPGFVPWPCLYNVVPLSAQVVGARAPKALDSNLSAPPGPTAWYPAAHVLPPLGPPAFANGNARRMFLATIRDPRSASNSTANEDAEEVLIITQDPAYRRVNDNTNDSDAHFMNSSALSVDCDLSPVAMAKLGQEPHLSTLIGRTSDLEHSPGLIVQLHPKVEAPMDLGKVLGIKGATTLYPSATRSSSKGQSMTSPSSDSGHAYHHEDDDEEEEEGGDDSTSHQPNASPSSSSSSWDAPFKMPPMSVGLLLRRHLLSSAHRAGIATQVCRGMASFAKLMTSSKACRGHGGGNTSANPPLLKGAGRKWHGNLCARTVLLERFEFDNPRETLVSVADYWAPESAHLIGADPRYLPPEAIAPVLKYMSFKACTWAEAAAAVFSPFSEADLQSFDAANGRLPPSRHEDLVNNLRVQWDSKMDVWSLGLTMWELYSDGARPFNQAGSDEIAARMLCSGDVPKKPPLMPDDLYELCERCWAEDVRDRPAFPEIVRLAEKSELSLLEQWDETKDAFLGRSGEAAAALAGGGIAQGTGSQHKEGHKTKKKSAPGFWPPLMEQLAEDRGPEGYLDLLRMFGVSSSPTSPQPPRHAPASEVARRLGRLRDLLSADPSLRAPRVALGCLDGIGYLTALGRRYLRHLEIAEPLTEIMRLLVAYSGSDALKTALVADGRVIRLVMEMSTRHKGLSELMLRIHFQTYLLLQDLLLPHVTSNTLANNSSGAGAGNGSVGDGLSMERAGERRAILEQAHRVSKFVTVDLRALLSYQRSKGFEGAMDASAAAAYAQAAAVPKFTFQTTDYAHRASDARARDEAVLGAAAVQHYQNEEAAAKRHASARDAAHKAAEQYTLELKRARLRFFATLTRGAGVLKLLCAAPPRAAARTAPSTREDSEKERLGPAATAAAAEYTRVPGAAAQLGKWRLNCCPALTSSTSSKGGDENATKTAGTTKDKAGFWGSSTLEPGQWTSDDVSKDRLVFKLGAVDLCTRLVNLGAQGRCPTLVVQALQSLRNLVLVTPPPAHVLKARAKQQQQLQQQQGHSVSASSSSLKALKRLPDNGNLRKAALLGGSGSAGNSSYHEGEATTASVACVHSSVQVSKQHDQQEVVVSVIPLQVRVAVAAQGDLMHDLSFLLEAHKKRAPKVVEAGLSLLVALCTTTTSTTPSNNSSRKSSSTDHTAATMVFGTGSASEVAAKHCAQLMNEAYVAAPRLALAAIDLYTGGAIALEHRAAFEPQRRDLVEFPDKRSSLSSANQKSLSQAEQTDDSSTWLFQALGGTSMTGSSGGSSSRKSNSTAAATSESTNAADAQKQKELSVGAPEPGSARMWAENGESDSEADKKASARGAVVQALALLRNLAAPVGPAWAVESRRTTLVDDLKVHERTTAALLAFPHEAQVQANGCAVLKFLTDGSGFAVERRRDLVASCGGVAAVAKALEQDFVPPGAALAASAASAPGRTNSSISGDGSGSSSGEKLLRGVLAAAADATSSASSSSSTAANSTSAGFEEMFPMAKASATRVSAQAVAALQNIHRNANRERAAKELAESPKTIANGNGRDHELLRALKPADYDALFYDGEADAHRVARTSVSKAIKHAMRPPPPKPLPPKGAPPPPPGVPELPLAMQPAMHALSDAMHAASATAATAAHKSSSLLLPADNTQRGGDPATTAAKYVRPEKTSNRFQVPISPLKESSPTLDAAFAAQRAAITAHDTTFAAASAGVDGSVAVTQAVNEAVFVTGANAALREAELAAEATNRTLNSSLGLLKQIFD